MPTRDVSHPPSRRRIVVLGLATTILGAVGGAYYYQSQGPQRTEEEEVAAETLHGVIESEELILRYTPRLEQLSKSVANLSLEDYRSADLFAPTVEVHGLSPSGDLMPVTASEIRPVHYEWPVEQEPTTGPMTSSPWDPLFATIDHFEHAKIYFIRGEFLDEDLEEWKAVSGFTGLARAADGRLLSLKGKQELYWRKDSDAEQ